MTIAGALSELRSMLEHNDIPAYYKPPLEKVIETIEMEFEELMEVQMSNKPTKLYNRASVCLTQLERVVEEMQKKIKTQAEELGRKDERIKEIQKKIKTQEEELRRKDEQITELAELLDRE